jgi:hypothetical protein
LITSKTLPEYACRNTLGIASLPDFHLNSKPQSFPPRSSR